MSPIVTHFEIIDQMDSLKIQGQINTAKMILADNRKICNEVLPKIVSLLNTEKEIVVLDAPAPSDGVYSDVRNLECEADSTDAIEQTSGATLETRIDSESDCPHYNDYWFRNGDGSFSCGNCGELMIKAIKKES